MSKRKANRDFYIRDLIILMVANEIAIKMLKGVWLHCSAKSVTFQNCLEKEK